MWLGAVISSVEPERQRVSGSLERIVPRARSRSRSPSRTNHCFVVRGLPLPLGVTEPARDEPLAVHDARIRGEDEVRKAVDGLEHLNGRAGCP